MTAGRPRELRLAWCALGLLLVAAFALRARALWTLTAALPWITGAAILWSPRSRPDVERLATALSEDASTRVAGLWLLTLVCLAAFYFTPDAALLLLTWMGAVVLVVLRLGVLRDPRVVVVGPTVTATALLLAAGGLELLLRVPPVARWWGAPQTLAGDAVAYDSLWVRNALGFRSRYESFVRQPGVFRVVALGDSFTWGDLVADSDSTWPALFERALQQISAERVEVINLGQRGYTTVNEAELLRRVGWQFAPDLVIIQYLLNDALPSAPDFRRVGDEWQCAPLHLVPVRFRTERFKQAFFPAFLEARVNALIGAPRGCPERMRQLYTPDSETWAAFRAALVEVGDSARSRGVPAILMLFPVLYPGRWTAETYPLRDVYAQVREAAVGVGLRVLDLIPAFAAAGADWRGWWVTPFDSHPSEEAYALAARQAFEFVTAEGLARIPSATK